MRITLFWSYYPAYIRGFYARHQDLSSRSYEEQLRCILADYFGWPTSVAICLAERGHEVQILLVNAEPLQRSWASENKVPFNPNTWQYSIPAEQVRQFKPEILWIGSMFRYFGAYLGHLRPYCRRLFAWAACPLPRTLDLSHIDRMLTSHSHFLTEFKRLGKPGDVLLPCFDVRILEGLGPAERTIQLSFIGSVTLAQQRRIHLLHELATKTSLAIWTTPPPLFSRHLLRGRCLKTYFTARRIAARSRGQVYGMDMYRVLAQSRMTLNVHGEVAAGIAGNTRMFEATGTGTLLFTEHSSNITDLFEPGREVITYKSGEDLLELIKYYGNARTEAENIAKAGQSRTLCYHDAVTRSRQLEEVFLNYL